MPFFVLVLASSAIAVATIGATLMLRSRPIAAVSAGVIGAMALLVVHGLFFDTYHDDAYITLRYSRHLADGLGPNWNSVGRVEGYTSFLWMALLGGLGKLGLDLVDTSRVLGVVATLATFLILYRVWKLWADEEPDSGLASPLVLVVSLLGLALTDSVAFWSFSGMETALFMALIVGSAYLYFLERRGQHVPWSAVALAAAAMTRPEALIAVAVTGGFKAYGVARSADTERALREYLVWAATFLLLFGSYFVWRFTYYGYLLPNTFYAKVGPGLDLFDSGLRYVADAGQDYYLLALFAGTAVLLTVVRISRDAAYIIVLTASMLAGIVFVGGDAFANSRFIAPLLPLLLLGGLAGFAVLLRRVGLEPRKLALVASVALSLAGLALLPLSNDPALAPERESHKERVLLGAWLNEHTPPDYTIAAFAVGAISYQVSDRTFLDMLGLNDVTIAHTDVGDLGRGILGHEKYNIDYVLAEVRPEIIIYSDADTQPFTEADLRERFRLRHPVPAVNELFNDPRLWQRYQVRSLFLDDKWFNFLQRRDTVAEFQAEGLR